MRNLAQKLEDVNGSYPDFVLGITLNCQRYGLASDLERYLDSHPDADDEDVILQCRFLRESKSTGKP